MNSLKTAYGAWLSEVTRANQRLTAAVGALTADLINRVVKIDALETGDKARLHRAIARAVWDVEDYRSAELESAIPVSDICVGAPVVAPSFCPNGCGNLEVATKLIRRMIEAVCNAVPHDAELLELPTFHIERAAYTTTAIVYVTYLPAKPEAPIVVSGG